MANLIWFRRDLRVMDQPALYQACTDPTQPVIGLYLITPEWWQKHDDAKVKIAFWLQNLAALKTELDKLNIPLLIRECNPINLNTVFTTVLKDFAIDHIFNIELEPDEMQRDEQIKVLCSNLNCHVITTQQVCILSPGTVLKDDRKPYTVFTPFKKKWLLTLLPEHYELIPKPRTRAALITSSDNLEAYLDSYTINYDPLAWPAGEHAVQQRLAQFCAVRIIDYNLQRDYPAHEGTSRVSAYLTAGVISAKQCLHTALQAPDSSGKETWINELIWRDFYKQILYFFPRVGKHRAFNLATEKLNWENNADHFQAWCKGQTGIPIVDAAMKQLNQTGWMHNRLRMVCAMFLSKNLFLDWRLGEKYFMENLLDGDLAANNGGWQWSASTGTDAAPYFRIFNPYSQSERFDPEGKFIRQYCPELMHLDNKQIHEPPVLKNYPSPIVDVKKTRLQAIERFKKVI